MPTCEALRRAATRAPLHIDDLALTKREHLIALLSNYSVVGGIVYPPPLDRCRRTGLPRALARTPPRGHRARPQRRGVRTKDTRTPERAASREGNNSEEGHHARCARHGGVRHHRDYGSRESGSCQHRQAGLQGVGIGCGQCQLHVYVSRQWPRRQRLGERHHQSPDPDLQGRGGYCASVKDQGSSSRSPGQAPETRARFRPGSPASSRAATPTPVDVDGQRLQSRASWRPEATSAASTAPTGRAS